MRTDPGQNREFIDSNEWKSDGHLRFFERNSATPNGGQLVNSFSGHERNRLFLSHQGNDFFDASLVSGLDSKADGRAMVLWDFDRDGWTDIAVVNANSPQLEIFRNTVDRHLPDHNSLSLRFVGGQNRSVPSNSLSNRDGYGTKVWVHVGDDSVIYREHRCGEGFSAQNSATMLVGIGAHQMASKIVVQWPSGMRQEANQVPAGSLTVWHETRRDRPFEMLAYEPIRLRKRDPDSQQRCLLDGDDGVATSDYTLYVAMATWCEKCKNELPQLRYLQSRFPKDRLRIVGFPADQKESNSDLQNYEDRRRPPFEILKNVSPVDRSKVETALSQALGTTRLSIPAVMLIDSSGQIVSASLGAPNASEMAKSMTTHER